MSEYIFSSTDKFGRVVQLTKAQLNTHIAQQSGHKETLVDPLCIEQTIKDPDFVFDSSYHPEREKFFGKGKHRDHTNAYVAVIVDYSSPESGFVVSAWTTPQVGTSIGRLLYDKQKA